MRLNLKHASSYTTLIPTKTLLKPPKLPHPNSSHSASTPSPPILHPPLFLNPPIHSTPISALHRFQSWAKTLTSSSSTAFEIDNGPDTNLLLRELNWLLEDTIENFPQMGSEKNEGLINLRVCLDDLYSLWKERIEGRRPFQYIVGCEHWRDLVLCVREGVLIPRPETELIVDLVGDVVSENGELGQGLWVDLGTGSGAIAIGVSRVLGDLGRVIATDLSSTAVMVAGYNVERYGLQNKIEIRQGSWFEPLKDLEGELAGLVSNPPYIPSDHIIGLQAEVSKHEPTLALDGGVNGLDYLVHLSQKASTVLKPGGFFAFETNGEKHCEFLLDYMENECRGNFRDVSIVPDFAGIQRFVTGFRYPER